VRHPVFRYLHPFVLGWIHVPGVVNNGIRVTESRRTFVQNACKFPRQEHGISPFSIFARKGVEQIGILHFQGIDVSGNESLGSIGTENNSFPKRRSGKIRMYAVKTHSLKEHILPI